MIPLQGGAIIPELGGASSGISTCALKTARGGARGPGTPLNQMFRQGLAPAEGMRPRGTCF
jgi:hypothetical protein